MSEVLTVPSVMVQVNVYNPSTETETLELRRVGLAKTEIPGPPVCVHKPLPVSGSFAFNVIEKPQVDWSNPALAFGAGRNE